jgi:outer membrane protein OmpA-like peptidoglycan-associated protein
MNNPVKLGLVALVAAAVLGCAQKGTADHAPPREREAASITQIGYGPAARFVTCPVPGCLQPTPKTLIEAPAAGAAAPAAPTPITLTATAPLPTPTPASTPPAAPAPAPVAPPAADDKAEADGAMPQRVYINFPAGSARLDAEAKEQLDRLVPFVAEAERIVIKGRTDERGDNDTNDRLALRRAMAVYDHLKRAARAGDKPFKLLAKGACCYIARNDTEAGRAANRRAEIDFVVPLQASVSPTRRATSKAHSS